MKLDLYQLLRTVLYVLLGAILAYTLSALIEYAIVKSDYNRCLVLEKQAQTLTAFYLTNREATMCATFGIYPPAPTK